MVLSDLSGLSQFRGKQRVVLLVGGSCREGGWKGGRAAGQRGGKVWCQGRGGRGKMALVV